MTAPLSFEQIVQNVHEYAKEIRYQTQSYGQWITCSHEKIRGFTLIMDLAGSLFRLLGAVLEATASRRSTPTINVTIQVESKEERERRKKEEEEERAQTVRILAAIGSVLGVIGLAHMLSKDAAKVKDAKELEQEVKQLELDDCFFDNGDQKGFTQSVLNLLQKVQTNTTKVKIIPKVVMLAGCGLTLIGSLYKSYDLMKGGGLIALAGIVVKVFVNNAYAKEDREIYNLANDVCTAVNSIPSAPPPYAQYA